MIISELTAAKVESQQQYCHKKELPCFISSDGKCAICNKDMLKAYTPEECANELITKCRECDRSLCE